jgi:energy-coupling factor transporter ATP-binding protein EcfA2
VSVHLRNLIIEYAKTLPDWQKILAWRAFGNSEDLNADKLAISEAVERFKFCLGLSKNEAGKLNIQELNALPMAVETQAANFKTKLLEVKNVEGVNALYEGQRITFSNYLTIIYGDNGSGKSGYSRLLNNAFYSRGDKELLPNILLPKPEQKQPKASFVFESNGNQAELSFPPDKNSKEFSAFACFDTKTVDAHVGKENELFVVPREMVFFKRLADLTTLLKSEVSKELTSISEKYEFADKFIGESDIKTNIHALKTLQHLEAMKSKADLSEEHHAVASHAEQEYNRLKQIDPKDQTQVVNAAKAELSLLKAYLMQSQTIYEKSKTDLLLENVRTLKELKILSAKMGADSFRTNLFQILDSNSWKNFLSTAVIYIKSEKDISRYPTEADACPLCLQKLNDDSIALFKRYFEFLADESESKIKIIESDLEGLKRKIVNFSIKSTENYPKLKAVLPIDSNTSCKQLASYLDGIRTVRDKLVVGFSCSNFETIEGIDFSALEQAVQEADLALSKHLEALEETVYRSNLAESLRRHTEYEHQKIFSILYMEMETFFQRLTYKEKLALEEKKITTRPITEKQTSIFNEYFTKQYKTKFHLESAHLNINFSIDVKPKGSSGSTGRKLDVLTHSPSKVLSEGEQRAIALADFLTEIEICNISGGLIFDDPVNSLDHERKAEIAKRLVLESQKRQVIVFTHDISFLFDLICEAEKIGLKEGVEIFCHWIKKIGQNVGLVDLNHKKKMEKDYLKPMRANDYLLKAEQATDPQEKEDFSRQGFDCLRQTYEAFVLFRLFKETVVRFDRRIGHKSVGEVFCPPEIGKFVSEKLEFCSGFVFAHLAADRQKSKSPSPELLKKEITDFYNFEKEFTEKRKAVFGVA